MKNFDSFRGQQGPDAFCLELTCAPQLWNHRNTVALKFASGEGLPNRGAV